MEKRMQLLHKCSFLHYSHNRASYPQKLEKAQLVVTCKITQSLHCTLLLFFFFTRSSKHAASSSRKRCFQGQPMRWYGRTSRVSWKKCDKQYSFSVSSNLAAGVPMYAKHRASFYVYYMCIYIYLYIYMYNIYIMNRVTVCHLRAVLLIMIPGQQSFFFLLLCRIECMFGGFSMARSSLCFLHIHAISKISFS